MCLFKAHIFPKLSSKPIKVWKIVDTTYSKYYYAPYRRIIYTSNIVKCSTKYAIIKAIFKNNIKREGVHAYTSKLNALKSECFNYFPHVKIIEAVIPPFTPYWLGKYGDIAATKMILNIDVK